MRFSSSRPAWTLAVVIAAGIMVMADPAGAQDHPPPAPVPAAQVLGVADPAGATDQDAALLAETAGRVAALTEENDRLRAEVAALTESRAAAQVRAQNLTVRLEQRTLLTGAGVALGAVLIGMLLGRIGARRRRSGF